MNYEKFKCQFLQAFKAYLPADYRDWQLDVREIPKVNGFLEGIHLLPETGSGISPTLYLHELYQDYTSHHDFEKTCRTAAEIFVSAINCVADLDINERLHLPKERVFFSLIRRKGNERLLEMVPHRPEQDLALIYRIMVGTADGGFNSAIINCTMMEEMGVTEEELHRLAMENTPRLMPAEMQNMDEHFLVLSNRQKALGAGTLLYPGVLEAVAAQLGGDFYVLPSSIHEVFAVPDAGQDVRGMNRVVKAANETVVKQEEILSDHVYHYDREKKELTMGDVNE